MRHERWYTVNRDGKLCLHIENDGPRAARKGLQAVEDPVDLAGYISDKEVRQVIQDALEKGARAEKKLQEVFILIHQEVIKA